MKELLGEEWYEILKDEFNQDYMRSLASFVTSRRAVTTVYPKSEDVFNAYKYTPYSQCRVCIIGQDPYINEGQAHGLAFSTKDGSYTPSLRNIEYAIFNDGIMGEPFYWGNDLTRWALQGVMLLNSVLTVDKGVSNSHAGKGWEKFTAKTVEELDKKGIIFLLWGNSAKEYTRYIKKSTIFASEHPVAASYQNRVWRNDNCFQKVNEILTPKIKW